MMETEDDNVSEVVREERQQNLLPTRSFREVEGFWPSAAPVVCQVAPHSFLEVEGFWPCVKMHYDVMAHMFEDFVVQVSELFQQSFMATVGKDIFRQLKEANKLRKNLYSQQEGASGQLGSSISNIKSETAGGQKALKVSRPDSSSFKAMSSLDALRILEGLGGYAKLWQDETNTYEKLKAEISAAATSLAAYQEKLRRATLLTRDLDTEMFVVETTTSTPPIEEIGQLTNALTAAKEIIQIQQRKLASKSSSEPAATKGQLLSSETQTEQEEESEPRQAILQLDKQQREEELSEVSSLSPRSSVQSSTKVGKRPSSKTPSEKSSLTSSIVKRKGIGAAQSSTLTSRRGSSLSLKEATASEDGSPQLAAKSTPVIPPKAATVQKRKTSPSPHHKSGEQQNSPKLETPQSPTVPSVPKVRADPNATIKIPLADIEKVLITAEEIIYKVTKQMLELAVTADLSQVQQEYLQEIVEIARTTIALTAGDGSQAAEGIITRLQEKHEARIQRLMEENVKQATRLTRLETKIARLKEWIKTEQHQTNIAEMRAERLSKELQDFVSTYLVTTE